MICAELVRQPSVYFADGCASVHYADMALSVSILGLRCSACPSILDKAEKLQTSASCSRFRSSHSGGSRRGNALAHYECVCARDHLGVFATRVLYNAAFLLRKLRKDARLSRAGSALPCHGGTARVLKVANLSV